MNREPKRSALALLSKYRSVVMGFAALSILYFHEWQYLFVGHDRLLHLEDIFHRSFYFGVDIFFLLSGIGLTFACAKMTSVWHFWGKRLKRIAVPALVAALCIALTNHWTALDYLKNVTGWNFWFHNMYSFLWFIPAILSVYAVFPLYWRFFSRAKNQLVFTLAALLIWAVFCYGGTHFIRPDLYGFFNRIPIFLTGVQLGWMTQQEKLPEEQRKGTFDLDANQPLFWGCIALMFVAGCVLSYLTNQKGLSIVVPDSNCRIPTYLLGISIAFLLVKLCDVLDRSKVGKAIIRCLNFFGVMSLEFYAIQEWLGWLLIPRLQPHMANWLINLVVLFVVTAAGYALWALNHYLWAGVDALASKTKAHPKERN